MTRPRIFQYTICSPQPTSRQSSAQTMVAFHFASPSFRPVFVQSLLRYPALTRARSAFSTSAISRGSVSDVVQHDHRELEECCENIVNATDAENKVCWQNQFTWELARHSVAEELVVYPAMEQHVPNGAAMADRDRKEHYGVISVLLLRLDSYCFWSAKAVACKLTRGNGC
jgi:hypothetical protein